MTAKRSALFVWTGFVLAALLALGMSSPIGYPVAIAIGAAALVVATRGVLRGAGLRSLRWDVDPSDLLMIAVSYAVIVGAFRLAFGVFGVDHVAGLFFSFGGGMTLGVVGPVAYMVLVRHRPLRSIGLGLHNLRRTVTLALLFGGTQFGLTMWGYDLPAPVDWVPLAVMALTVGLFEAIYFRGFVQGRLEESFGVVPGVAGAAALYAAYHVGYGMNLQEMVFLFGLGITYAVAYRTTNNILVLWPLLLPVGSLYNHLESLEIELPWASILGFADVLALMVGAVVVVRRIVRRRRPATQERERRPAPPRAA